MRRSCGRIRLSSEPTASSKDLVAELSWRPALAKCSRKDARAAVQLARGGGDLLGLLGDLLLAPAQLDRAQQADQRGRCRDQDLLLERVVVERGLGLEGGVQGRLGGHEADDEVGCLAAVELVLVALRGEFGDVVAHLAGVADQLALAARVVLGLEHLEVGVERHLGVDHDATAGRQHHDGVGPQDRPRRR